MIITFAFSLAACESSAAKQALEQAKFAMAEGDYTKSLNMYQLALNEGSKDKTITNTITVLTAYQNAFNAFEQDNVSEAKTILEGMTIDYQSLSIKGDMDNLKASIQERVSEIDANNIQLQELQTLFDQQSYQVVIDKATQMLTWNLTEEQKVGANSLLEQSNKIISTPKMDLKYVVNQSDMELQGKFYQNGEGKLTFISDEPFQNMGVDSFYPDVKYITYTTPMSRVRFQAVNSGSVALKNPIIKFEFQDVYLIPKDYDGKKELTFSNFVNGIGTYTDVTWSSQAKTIQPGMTQEFTLDLSECAVLTSKANVKITVAADNLPARTFTVPVTCQ